MKNGSWELIDLYPGAHIRVKVGNFYHHGIYIGNGEVVQFGLPFDMAENSSDIRILRSPLSQFTPSANDFIEVYRFSAKVKRKKQSDGKIVQTALAHVGEGGYNIFTNNCEHFATFCVYGEKSSKQIDDAYKNVSELLKKDRDRT